MKKNIFSSRTRTALTAEKELVVEEQQQHRERQTDRQTDRQRERERINSNAPTTKGL